MHDSLVRILNLRRALNLKRRSFDGAGAVKELMSSDIDADGLAFSHR